MEKKTCGAWLVHHSSKLKQITGTQDFNSVEAAGKAGTLLSALSGNQQTSLDRPQVEALAKAASINVLLELDPLLARLKARKLIDVSTTGVDVLGVTTATVLERTAEVFEDLSPSNVERASLLLSEVTSSSPLRSKESREYLSDTCKLASDEINTLLVNSEGIGFVDSEDLGKGEKVYFNGNLFKRDNLSKIQTVLASLSSGDHVRIGQVEDKLKQTGCVPLDEVKKILGDQLFGKLNAISMYDVNVVNNDAEDVAYVTRPAAFSKFGDPFVEDALDLAKAFVSSITYGMTRSSYYRGKINMPTKLMQALIDGRDIGPVTAIGQDYKVLEMKGVVKVWPDRWGYSMRLLKKEVGEIALRVIACGDASDVSLSKFPSANLSSYMGPEDNRMLSRKRQSPPSKRETRDILMALRTGGVTG